MKPLFSFLVCLAGLAAQAAAPASSIAPSIAQGQNDLAFRLAPLIEKPGENLIFSPFSISTALMMAAEGADGATKTELIAALGWPAEFHAGIARYLAGLPSKHSTLKVANRIWFSQALVPERSYDGALTESYGSDAGLVDFQHHPEAAREAINQWVENQTLSRIKNLIPPKAIQQDTRLVIANAVYFKGQWATAFKATANDQKIFYPSRGEGRPIDFLNQSSSLAYFKDAKIAAIKLPYQGQDFSLIVAMANDKADELSLSSAEFQKIVAGMRSERIALSIPKFKFEFDVNLNEPLQKLGARLAFSSAADFSKITAKEPLRIGLVQHKAFIEIDEKGTEAAAATAVVTFKAGFARSSEPIPFVADHPFDFFVFHEPSQSILFMGKYARP